MKTKGLRISDTINNVVSVTLQDILEELSKGDQLYWSLLYFYGAAKLKNGKAVMDFAKEVRLSEKGISYNWIELNELANCFDDLWGIIIIGCKDEKLIQRYNSEKQMYESCDVVIEKVDSSYWEVFSKDISFIDRLASKFKNVEFLETDHLEKK